MHHTWGSYNPSWNKIKEDWSEFSFKKKKKKSYLCVSFDFSSVITDDTKGKLSPGVTDWIPDTVQ